MVERSEHGILHGVHNIFRSIENLGEQVLSLISAGIYLFQVNNVNTRKMCKISAKLRIETS